MKKLLLLFIIASGLRAGAQSAAACASQAQNICSNPNFVFQGINGSGLTSGLNVSNPSTNPQTGNGNNPSATANSGCLLTNGPGPQWLLLTVSVSGNLGFIFGAPSSANPQVGLYDWAMWPYTPSTCNNIFNNTLPPVACNWNATSSGGTGMGPVPAGGNVGNYQPSIPVTAGQQFLILISNYSGVNTSVSFTSTGTASLTCGFNSMICAGETTTVSPVGFVPTSGTSYTLMPGGFFNNTGTFTVTPLSTTVYTITGSGLNSQGSAVVQTSTTSIVVNPVPAAAPTVTQSTCTNTLNAVDLHLSFTPSSPVPSYTLTWSSTPQNFTVSTQQVVQNLGALPYDVTVTAAGGCSTVTHFTVNPQPAPATFTILPFGSNYTVTCAQPTVILDASNSSFTYTWSNGSAAPVVDTQAGFTSQSLGTWTVTGANPVSGCTSTHTISISQNTTAPTMAITPTLQNITCASTASTVTLSATSPTINIMHYIIGPSGNVSSAANPTAIYVPGGPGDYRDSLVIGSTGCFTVRHFSVSSNDVFPGLTVSSPQQFTLGCGTRSVATINLTSNNTTGTIKYNLSFPSATTVPTTFNSISQYTTAVPGTYTAYAQDPVNSCVTPVPFSIIANNFGPDIHATVPLDYLSCFTPTMQLTAVTANTLVTFQWSYKTNGTGNVVSVANPTVLASTNTNVTSPIANTFTLTIKDLTNECLSTLTVSVLQNQYPPKAGIVAANGSPTPMISCSAPNIQLNSNSFTSIPPNSGFPTNQNIVAMLWEGPSPQTPGTFTSNYQAYVAGPYTLTVRDMNNGCTSFTTLTVIDNRIYPILTPTVPVPVDCGSLTTTLIAITTVTNSSYQYQWLPGSGSFTGSINSRTFQPITPGIYGVVVTNASNGCSATGNYTVVPGSLTSSFAPDQHQGYAPLTVNFSNNSHSTNSNSGITTVWTFGNGTQTTTPSASISPVTVYNQPGTYVVTIFTSKGACQSLVTDTIRVDIPSKLEIPNVFTPNGDGVNDLFFLKVSNLTDITAKIYDRWGRLVYELVSNTGNIAWDGKNEKGVEVAAGTYFYIVKATGKDGQSYDTKGTVTLLK